ncbi:helix-turn-helix transcriptional regulator [Comamonas thiooxydans]|uniref:helix-turn-helix transcriptional regulator n=1 Tax=Comamonas thiooxydans TaxID=363952 RepID=UPI0009B8FC10|nr:AraC family transcriptional regulator [Comamonas thiooxydans]
MLSWIPKHWGGKYEVPEVGVAHTFAEPESIQCTTNAHYFMAFLSTLPKRTRSLNSDQLLTGSSPAGSFEIFPQNSDLFSSWSTAKETLLVGFLPQQFARLAQLEHEGSSFELHQPGIGVVDKKALFLCQQIKHEMLNESVGRGESLEALMTLLGIHILRTYTNLGSKPVKVRGGGLSARSWSRVYEYIHENTGNKLTLEMLAETAFLSPSHFLRAFKETTGQTPHQYVLKARLEMARGLMYKTELSFEDIAKISGFASNSHMSISIKKMWGMTPTKLRSLLKNQP